MDQQKEWSQFTAPEYGEILTVIRQRLDKTQMEMADLLDAGFTTYRKWEWGERKPRAGSRRLIREKFEETLYALGVLKRDDDPESKMPLGESEEQQAIADQKTTESPGPVVEEHSQSFLESEDRMDGAVIDSSEDTKAMRTSIDSNIAMHVWDLAYTDHLTWEEKSDAIQQAIEKFNTMNSTNKNYQITRRDAFSSVAMLPMIVFRLELPGSTVQSQQYGDALALCTAALEGCWQLYRSDSASNSLLAFRCVSKYLPALKAISNDSAPYRKEALDLAARYALLKTKMGFHHAGIIEAIRYGREALDLGKATGDILLQLSAYCKLAWAYLKARRYKRALETIQEGESVLQSYQRTGRMPPLPSSVIGDFYSTYAPIQIPNGISPDTSLGIATNSEPGKEHIAFLEFTLFSQLLETAATYCLKGDRAQTMIWLGKQIDLETLVTHPHIPQSESRRIAALNVLTRTLLQSKDQDVDHVIDVWTVGMEGSKALKSEQKYRDAVVNFEIMRAMWSGERSIMELIPLTKHWSEEEE